MSVFTAIEPSELQAFLEPYGLGRLHGFQGIAAGTENSNFFVSTDAGEFVLTLVERGDPQTLPFFIELLEKLHRAQLPVPYALATSSGETLRELAGKPALLQPRLPGSHVQAPNAHHCQEIGRFLAHMHLATQDDVIVCRSDRGLNWMLAEGPLQALTLDEDQVPLLRRTLAEVAELQPRLLALAQANLHADLFRDNALFDGNHLSGVIDFYNACAGPMLYDLAIACNDWCVNADGSLDAGRARALLAAYAGLRRFTPAEAELWPTMLRVACLRFWLSRLIAAGQASGPDVLVKPPEEFRQRLQQRQQVSVALPFAL
jgi:homoserine kinase type II